MSVLNSALLYAVSPSVITSLWSVEDKSRAVFMGIFYKSLEKNDSIADSLRVAQNEVIQMGYGPSDWGAFILTGRY